MELHIMTLSREKAGEIMHMWSVSLNAFLTTYILQAPLACNVRSLLAHVY